MNQQGDPLHRQRRPRRLQDPQHSMDLHHRVKSESQPGRVCSQNAGADDHRLDAGEAGAVAVVPPQRPLRVKNKL